MKVMVIDADILTKLTISKCLSTDESMELEFTTSQQVTSNTMAFFKQHPVDLILLNLCKGQDQKTCFEAMMQVQKTTVAVIVENQQLMHDSDIHVTSEYIIPKPFNAQHLDLLLKALIQSEGLPDNNFIDFAREVVLERNFTACYKKIKEFQQEITMSYQENPADTKDKLNAMYNELFTLMNCTNELQQKRYREKMNFSDKILLSPYYTQFLLYDLFKEVYRQRSIQKRPQLSQLYEYIDKNIYNDLSLAEAATCCNISQSYLSRVLKENYSLGFNTYIQMEKIMLAKKAFYNNGEKIIDVSFQLSYSEPSYFCKVFKRIEGSTPTEMKIAMEKSQQQ